MTLSGQQQEFSKYVGQLLAWIYTHPGWGVTLGEAFRTQHQQEEYFLTGKSKTMNSTHLQRLAIDLNFFVDGVYKTDTKDYKELGEYWKNLSPKCKWGGDFKTLKDGNHFEYGKQK